MAELGSFKRKPSSTAAVWGAPSGPSLPGGGGGTVGGQPPGGGGGPQPDFSKLLQMMGGGGGGGGVDTSSIPTTFQNTAQADPNTQWLLDQFKSRLSADPTQRAMDKAGGQARAAQAGQEAAIRDRFARLGMSGSGAEMQALADLAGTTQQAVAGTSADIAMGRERDLDQLVLGGQGIAGAPGAGMRADKALGLQQFQAQQAGEIAKINAQIAQQAAERARQTQLWGTFKDLWALS